jgi:hypothetical protein
VSKQNRQVTHTRPELRLPNVDSSDSPQPLLFPCVVTRLEGTPPLARCRTWIQGRDFHELGVAAAEQLDTTADSCGFTVVEPENAPGRTFLEVLHRNGEALVGPMAGPRVPSNVSASPFYFLDDLIERLSLNEGTSPSAVTASHRYIVTVRYASIWDRGVYPPPRSKRESDASYRDRCAAAENFLIDRTSQQGFFAAQYSVPVCDWTACDLTGVIELVYQHLPTSEPCRE